MKTAQHLGVQNGQLTVLIGSFNLNFIQNGNFQAQSVVWFKPGIWLRTSTIKHPPDHDPPCVID
jgi:hypothetical protein